MRSGDALIGVEFGGTFVMDPHGSRGRNFASFEYCPEAYEDEVVVSDRRHSRFVPVDEVPAANGHESVVSVFPKLKGSLKENLRRLLKVGPQWAILAYEKARVFRGPRPDSIMRLLPVVMAELVAEGVYSPVAFQTTNGNGQTYYRVLVQSAKDCPVARAMLQALNSSN